MDEIILVYLHQPRARHRRFPLRHLVHLEHVEDENPDVKRRRQQKDHERAPDVAPEPDPRHRPSTRARTEHVRLATVGERTDVAQLTMEEGPAERRQQPDRDLVLRQQLLVVDEDVVLRDPDRDDLAQRQVGHGRLELGELAHPAQVELVAVCDVDGGGGAGEVHALVERLLQLDDVRHEHLGVDTDGGVGGSHVSVVE